MSDDTKDSLVKFTVTADEQHEIRVAAAEQDKSMAEYARDLALDPANTGADAKEDEQ